MKAPAAEPTEHQGKGRVDSGTAPVDRLLARFLTLPPLLFFLLATPVLVGPHLLPPTEISQLSYDVADSFIHLWNFWWTKTWITSLSNPYFTELLYNPFGTSLAVHGYALPYSILLTPLQWLIPGMTGLVVSFNVVVFGSFVLSGFGAYRLARFVTGHHVASLVAGVVFAFMPFHFLNMARFNLLCVEFLPFYVHALLALWESPSGRRAAALAGWLALCFYTSLEYALYLLIFSALWFLYVAIADRARLSAARLVALAQAAALFLLIASPLLWQQARLPASAEKVSVERGIDEIVYYSPALLSYFTPSRVHPLYGETFRFAGVYPDPSHWGMRSETSVSLMTWVLVIVGALGLRRGGRAFWVAAAAIFLVLALGPQLRMSGTWLTEITLPYRWLYEFFPPIRGSRDPTRLFPLALLMLAILAAYGTRTLVERGSERSRHWIGGALVAVVIIESLVVWRPKLAPPVPEVYEELASEADRGPIIDMNHTLVGLLGQTVHGRPIGYVSGIALRGAPRLEQFDVETAFRRPRRILDLKPADRKRAMGDLRRTLERDRVERLLFPRSPISSRQAELARLLGARVSSHGGTLVADVSDLSVSP